MYNSFGFVDRPLNPSGVPPIKRKYLPVGFEEEIRTFKEILKTFKRGNDNITIVIVGQYGWGKTELLDALEEEALKEGMKVVRAPLTLSLDLKGVIRAIANARREDDRPIAVLIDEADEVTRLVEITTSLKPDEVDRVRDLIIKIGSLIRLLLEPRNYRDVLKIIGDDLVPELFTRLLIVLSLTPQLYYNVLKNFIPDVFDITRGRVYREIVIDERFPYWLFEAALIERFKAYSNEERLEKVERGLLSPLYPFKREYLVTLYEAVSHTEGRKASPRGLLKFASKLLDFLAERGEPLNYKSFEEFIKHEVKNGELHICIGVLDDYKFNDEKLNAVFKALLLSGIPRGVEDLEEELGFNVKPYVEALAKAGLVEEVHVLKLELSNDTLKKLREGLITGEPLPLGSDVRDVSFAYGIYYTGFENGRPWIYVITQAKVGKPAYQVLPRLHKELFSKLEAESAYKAREEVLKAFKLVDAFDEGLIREFVRSVLGSDYEPIRIGKSVWGLTIEPPLDIRLGVLAFLNTPFDEVQRIIRKVVSEGVIVINNQERPIDALLIIALYKNALSAEVERVIGDALVSQRWKLVLGSAGEFVFKLVFGSNSIDVLKAVLAGSRLERLGSYPEEYGIFVERLRQIRESIAAFKEDVRKKALRLTLAIRRGARESKEQVLRRIVEAWIQGKELPDQPDVFKCPDGKACISKVEECLVEYLRLLGKKSYSTRELEALIKRLFPVQLWREFREADLIRLMRLRGLILPTSPDEREYTPFSPDALERAISIAEKRLELLRERLEASATFEIGELGEKITIKAVLPSTSSFSECLKALKLLKSTPESSPDILRRYAQVVLCIDAIEEQIAKELPGVLGEIKSFGSSLINSIKSVLGEIETFSGKDLIALNGLKSHVDSLVTGLREFMRGLIRKLDGLDISEAREVLPSIQKTIREESSRTIETLKLLKKIDELAAEYLRLCEKAIVLKQQVEIDVECLEGEEFISDISMLLGLSNRNEALSDYSEKLEEALAFVRKAVAEGQSRISLIMAEYEKMAEWILSKARSNVFVRELTLKHGLTDKNIDVNRLREFVSVIDKVLEELALKLEVPIELIREIASKGPNAIIDEIELARRIGVEKDHVERLLEFLYERGIIGRKYTT